MNHPRISFLVCLFFECFGYIVGHSLFIPAQVDLNVSRELHDTSIVRPLRGVACYVYSRSNAIQHHELSEETHSHEEEEEEEEEGKEGRMDRKKLKKRKKRYMQIKEITKFFEKNKSIKIIA